MKNKDNIEDINTDSINDSINDSNKPVEKVKHETKKFERLVLITEGGVHMIEYLLHNRVVANSIVLDATKFKEILPYLDTSDDVLLIIKGLTDFTMSDIYTLIGSFKQNIDKLGRVTILSNVMLGKIDFDYYLYSGDLFYGNVKKISNGRVVEDDDYDTDLTPETKENKLFNFFKRNKATDKNENSKDVVRKNAVANAYKVYNSNNVKVQIYSKDKKDTNEQYSSENGVLQRVKSINLYAES